MSLSLSLVICTRNRARQLSHCLDAIAAMDKPARFELVLVDNDSTDDTAQELAKFADKADFTVKLVSEPIAGLGQARQTGWQAASGDIVGFTDDDCYVARDYATELLAAMKAHPEADFFGGKIVLHDPADLPVTILIKPDFRTFEPHNLVRPGAIQGANFGVRRSALAAAGGVDVRLGAGTRFPAEDIELVGRLAALGHAGVYLPKVEVRHHHGRRTKAELTKLFDGYERGAGAYYALMWRYPHMRPAVAFVWLVRAARRRPRRWLNEIRAMREFNRQYPV